MAFVGFFPQLVAGPRSVRVPFCRKSSAQENFTSVAQSGLRLMLWGMFKKVVVADTCAPLVDNIFAHHDEYKGLTLIFGAVLFAFQIYGDFSGYSDMAIGTGRLFGIQLNTNFATPYFSKHRRVLAALAHLLVHLVQGLRLHPAWGSRHGMTQTVRNTFVIFGFLDSGTAQIGRCGLGRSRVAFLAFAPERPKPQTQLLFRRMDFLMA